MSWHLPPSAENDLLHRPSHSDPGVSGNIDYNQGRFVNAYVNLGFGWLVANEFSRLNIPFPSCLQAEDQVVFQAYLHNCNKRYYCHHIWEANMIKNHSLAHKRNTLEALLLVENMTIEEAADHLNIPVPVVRAYEKLFFNILDRRKDAQFLAQVVYPNHRFVETFDNYFKEEAFDMLLKRNGYNAGAFYSMHWSGCRSNLVQLMTGASTPAELELYLFANAYVMARSGVVNQQANTAGLRHAQALLTAAKHGGEEQASTSPMEALGTILTAEVERVKGAQADEHALKRMGLQKASLAAK